MPGLSLKHRTSKESYESASTVRRERPVQRSFLDIGVEEESGEDEGEDLEEEETPQRPGLQHTQSFLDFSIRQSGDTLRENEAMFS